MTELNEKKFKTTRSTRFSVKTLFYLGNKSIAHSTQLFVELFYRVVALKV